MKLRYRLLAYVWTRVLRKNLAGCAACMPPKIMFTSRLDNHVRTCHPVLARTAARWPDGELVTVEQELLD